MIFEPDFVGMSPSPRAVPRARLPSGSRRSRALFEAAAREFGASTEASRARLLLRGLVETIGGAFDVGPECRQTPPWCTRSARRSTVFSRAHEVAAYAAILRCSTRTLTRHCERWIGKPAKRLIDERVALEAKRMLAHGGAPAADLAPSLGFADATQFVKFFRRLTGETPARFRARYQG